MSIIDKAIAAMTMPSITDEKRMDARRRARAAAEPGDWLSLILDHHEGIEQAFAAVKTANTVDGRRSALKRLAILLTGHATAEETVIYPALAAADKQGHANTAYTEQAAAKMQMAALEQLAPLSQDFADKLAHLEAAVSTHIFQEEDDWFLDLKRNAPTGDQDRAGRRYAEEYNRYVDDGLESPVAPEPRSFGEGYPE